MILHTDITGQGTPLLLIHGLFGSNENLGMIARLLASQFRVINVDLRNHGRSGHSNELSYALMAQDLIETMDALQIPAAAVLGHSMGGKAAMQLALSQPDRVSKLVLADISPVVSQARHVGILEALNRVELASLTDRKQADAQLQTAISDAGTRAFLLKSLVKGEHGFQWRFNLAALTAQYQQVLATPSATGPYSGPTLFIKGGNSDYLQPEHQAYIRQLFPEVKAKIIEGTGHWLHAEKPAAFAKITADFLLS
ncbi:MAG: alpha/beta fold hydrolase [Rheinheimera sp.]|nr:alpha/beta fold hydrolase [Rheinheimera sp.]